MKHLLQEISLPLARLMLESPNLGLPPTACSIDYKNKITDRIYVFFLDCSVKQLET